MSDSTLADLAAEVARLRDELKAMKVELTVQRVNIVEPDGTLKLVISNSARSHGGTIDGMHLAERDGKRPAGIIYFNDEGDECGGLAWHGRKQDGRPAAGGHMTFDRYGDDQVIYWGLQDGGGDRWAAGFQIQDRAGESLGPILRRMKEIEAMPDGDGKNTALKELQGSVKAPQRLFLGRSLEGNAVLELKDGAGRARARLSVGLDGLAKLEFLDEGGAVVASLP